MANTQKERIKEIIRANQSRDLPEPLMRDLDVPLESGKIISLIGTRRSGKTYLLYQKMRELRSRKISTARILFLNFEDERLSLRMEDLDLILQAYRELYPDIPLKTCYFFFDEIQNVQGWEKFVRRVYDTESQNIFITGSNAKLLSSEIATSLRGRTLSYEVYPFSFREYLSFKKVPRDYYLSENKAKIISAFNDYLYTGGFPEMASENDPALRTKTLQDYFNVMIFRDLVERYNIANIAVLKYFIKKVLSTVSTTVSVNKIYHDIKSNQYEVSKNSLYTYFDYINTIYLIRRLDRFDFSSMKQEKSDKKIYAIDHGFLSAINFRFSKDAGKQLENLVALEWFKRGKAPMYFKQVKECDFVVEGDEIGNFHPYQVTYSLEDEVTKKRELEGLVAACKYLETKKGTILTMDEEADLTYKGLDVSVIPCWRFFL